MKGYIKVALVLAAVLFALTGCKKKDEAMPKAASAPVEKFSDQPVAEAAAGDADSVSGLVVETMDAGGYTYVRVQSSAGELWAAGPQTQVAVGDRLVMPTGMTMKNFTSDSLGRTFEEILFVQGYQVVGRMEPKNAEGGKPMTVDEMRDKALHVSFEGLVKAEGGLTVAEVLAGGSELVGKQVKVRGKVVKINRQIMERNWLHIQDGTGTEPDNDLTVTCLDDANAGDTVLIVGTVARNSATFHGGPEKVVVENAKVTIEVKAEKVDEKPAPADGEAKAAPEGDPKAAE
jgi:predicted small lipoprotein YifL